MHAIVKGEITTNSAKFYLEFVSCGVPHKLRSSTICIGTIVVFDVLSAIFYNGSHKSSHPKTFRNSFTLALYISVKFCQFVASLHKHRLANFGRFNLIFNKVA